MAKRSVSPRTQRLWVKQADLAARGTQRAMVIMAIVTIASLYWLGPGYNVWLPGGITILMAVSWVMDRRISKMKISKSTTVSPSTTGPRQTSTFEFVRADDDEYYSRTVSVNGRTIEIRIAASCYRACLACATTLADEIQTVMKDFAAFKESEAVRQPHWASFIPDLQIEHVDFNSGRESDLAEVSFTAESGGEPWTCAVRNGKFEELFISS